MGVAGQSGRGTARARPRLPVGRMAPSRPTTPGPGSPVSEGSWGLTQRLRVSTRQVLRTPNFEVTCGGCTGASGAVTRLGRTRGSRGPLCSKGQPAGMGSLAVHRGRAQRAALPLGVCRHLLSAAPRWHHPRVEPRSSAAGFSSREGAGFLSELCPLPVADTGRASGEQQGAQVSGPRPFVTFFRGWLTCSTVHWSAPGGSATP